MLISASNKNLSIQEYFAFEDANEIRHEFINGNLYEMSGASREHHHVCKRLLYFFEKLLASKEYEIFMENMKVAIPGENIFFYPDLLVTNEKQTDENRFAQYAPELLAEVVSDSSRTKDMVDKLLQYQKIPSLKYYLIAEQNKPEITVVSRNAKGNWESETFEGKDASVNLTALDAVLPLAEIYV